MSEAILEQFLNKIKVISDRLDSLEKTVQFINSERSILEDIRANDAAAKDLALSNREHLDNLFKDLRSELKIQGMKTTDKLEQTQEKVEDTHDKIDEVKKAIES